ncbi:hypothetical protein RHMOL_Rhmol08G0004300 [Rhododendron molle]|uniref:Uncharacterized protein n=1 Tax=Rhododendron molle TaxID=49168 RepID=A0ACC0MI00_RHOML|nr:hypothetical protein RHMOL_Rhmol08G0004300 [Rhododendron molle]
MSKVQKSSLYVAVFYSPIYIYYIYVLSFGLCFHDFLLIRKAKKHNTTLGGLDDTRQSMEDSTKSRSTETAPSDDSDNTQESPNVELQESPSMIHTSNNTEMVSPEISPGDEIGAAIERILMTLYKLVHKGDWERVKYYLEIHPDGLTSEISSNGETVLHLAVLGGHVNIVEELVHMMSAKDLEIQNKTGETSLSFAAAGGITKVAKPLVRKNHDLLGMKNFTGNIPVVVAAQFCNVDMVHYLYWATQEEDLDPERSDQGGKLLTTCIVAQIYDVALDLVWRFPGLAIEGETLHKLATRQSAFASGTQLVFWKQWIYSCIPVHSPRPRVSNIHWDIEADQGRPGSRQNIITQAPCIKHIHDIKVKHGQVDELLGSISYEISTLTHPEIHRSKLFPAVFDAVKHRNSEIVERSLKVYPDLVWILDEEDRNLFLFAVLHREEKVFCLLHEMGPRMNLIATSLDRNRNTILHHAAMLSPSSHLDHISGAALQMQRELQWFKEVEKLVQPMYRELLNDKGMTARALFTSQHDRMRKQGEKWMRDTATSCTVVAALIATIMFTSAFTVPGGYDNETGDPLNLDHDYFMTFIIADALSLLSSASSVLVFLGILKARYTESEFLFSLPCKLLLGVTTLFFSIVTMMLTFASTIFITLHDRLSWICIPIVLFCGMPVMIFTFPQVPLIYEIFVSTFGPGVVFFSPKLHVLSLGLYFHDFLLIRMAKKHNTTPGGLDNARQSMKEESIESQSTDTTSTSDDSDNAQGTPKLELEGSPSMISTPNSLETETPVEEPETSPGNEEGLGRERILMTLYKLVHKGDWEYVKDYLEQHPDALTTQISLTGDTALHIAVLGGYVKIVEELVHMISAKDLALPNRTGETALSLAAGGGITKVAKPLVRKNHDLLGMKNNNGNIPLVVAAQFGHVDMVHYLYRVTQKEDLDPERSDQGGKLLTTCISKKEK